MVQGNLRKRAFVCSNLKFKEKILFVKRARALFVLSLGLQSAGAFATCAKALVGDIDIEIRVERRSLGFVAEQKIEELVPVSLQEDVLIESFLSTHPNMTRGLLAEDLFLAQKAVSGEALSFYLSLSSFAETYGYQMKSVLEGFSSVRETLLKVAEVHNPSPVYFGPKKAAIEIYSSDVVNIMHSYPDGLPDNFEAIVGACVQLGARSAADVGRLIEVAQSFELEELYLASAISSIRKQLHFQKRVAGIRGDSFERVEPTFREALLLFGVMANVKELNKLSALAQKVKEYEMRPHLTYELEYFDDVIKLLSAEFNFSISLE